MRQFNSAFFQKLVEQNGAALRAAGFSWQQIGTWRYGITSPQINTLARIADTLGIDDLNTFFFADGDGTSTDPASGPRHPSADRAHAPRSQRGGALAKADDAEPTS